MDAAPPGIQGRKPRAWPGRCAAGVEVPAFGVYVHVPFCASRCSYCDFNTYVLPRGTWKIWARAVVAEARVARELLEEAEAGSLYVGGGTPSLIDPDLLGRVLNEVASLFSLTSGAEVSLEANPEDVTPARLRAWQRIGATRLSLGVQSFSGRVLSTLGRRAGADQCEKATLMALEAGFQVNLDLIYGTPGESLEEWGETLQRAISVSPQHISCYALTLEEGTPMMREVRRARLPAPDPDLQAEMYLLAVEELGRAGYTRYEVSNWALPGHACRHNLIYWTRGEYWGLGPGAHSFLGGTRFWNLRRLGPYARAALSGRLPVAGWEVLTREEEWLERLFLGLRLADGVDDVLFGETGWDPDGRVREELRAMGLLLREGQRIRLSPRGALLSNEVFVRLVS